jgi:hypothetical protein
MQLIEQNMKITEERLRAVDSRVKSCIQGNNNYEPTGTQCQCTQFHQTYFKGL